MDEIPKLLTSPATIDTGRWIGRVVVAVLLAEGIWGLIVSLTGGLIVPGLSRTMGGDPQSPLYLGKGDFNLPAVFVSILELCFTGMVAAALNYWTQRAPRPVRRKPAAVRVTPESRTVATAATAGSAMQSSRATSSAVAAPRPIPASSSPIAPASQPLPHPPPTSTPPAAPKQKPEPPKPPKEVYYNIVGEPINPTEDDE